MTCKKFSELRARLMAKPGAEERARKARARLSAEIECHEMTLGELRKAVQVTQALLAQAMNTSQPEVSRIEHQPDLLLSTAREYIRALGGELLLVARFPDANEVVVSVGELGIS